MKRLTISDQPERDYAKALDEADTLAKLRTALMEYELLAGDAVDTVAVWTDADFTDWRSALQKERHGQFMGDADAVRFATVLLPEVMFRITVLAQQFHVPFVVARDRLMDMRLLYRRGGRLVASQKLKQGTTP